MLNEFLWVEKYRPKTIADTILPEDLKNTFQEFVNQGNIPNLLLSGPAGCGKTTVARAMLEELGCDYILINGSMNGNIATLRDDILQFASTISFNGGRKYVILDEADYLTQQTQAALRGFIEEFSKNCGFILTCNFKNRIIGAVADSRCSVVDFKIKKSDLPSLAKQMMKRVTTILDQENVDYDKAAIAAVITKFHPDWRRTINEIQRYSATGKIDSGIIAILNETTIKNLIGFLKDRDFTSARKWVAENVDNDCTALYRNLYDNASMYVTKNSIPNIVLILSKYQYQHAFVADPEINLMACVTELMVECEFV